MTIEEIIQCDAAKLEAMTDNDLLNHFEKYFNITRPERSTAVVKKQEQQMQKADPKLARALQVAKSLGMDLTLFPAKLGRKK